MLINLAEIMSVRGKIQHIEAPFELTSFRFDGIEYNFVKKQPIQLTISSLGERKVRIECNTELSILIPCSRCLEEVDVPFVIHFSKELDFQEAAENEMDELEETNYIIGYNLDVDILVSEEIMIHFPAKVLCKKACKGICSTCGKNQNKGTCDCASQGKDPRMLAIQDIFKNFGQTDE